jgi:regulator of nucleoside diphosphate kinase
MAASGVVMTRTTNSRPLPAIIISDAEQERLVALAMAVIGRTPDIAEDLLEQMDRATVVDGDSVPANVVRMGSNVRYRTDDGRERRVTLVYSGEADIAEGRISILTPVGTALIGLAEGQSIAWHTPDGRERQLTVLEVRNEANG